MNDHGAEAVWSGHQVRSGPVGRDRGRGEPKAWTG